MLRFLAKIKWYKEYKAYKMSLKKWNWFMKSKRYFSVNAIKYSYVRLYSQEKPKNYKDIRYLLGKKFDNNHPLYQSLTFSTEW